MAITPGSGGGGGVGVGIGVGTGVGPGVGPGVGVGVGVEDGSVVEAPLEFEVPLAPSEQPMRQNINNTATTKPATR